MMAIGVARDVLATGIVIVLNALWRATLTESYTTSDFQMDDRVR